MDAEREWRPRTVLQVLLDQMEGVSAWQAATAGREAAEEAVNHSREARMDAQRRLAALRRAHRALIDRSEGNMAMSREILQGSGPRAVLVHRNEWLRDKLRRGLLEQGVVVVGELEDGADALGVVVAEQPDLLLVEDRLPSLATPDLIRSVRDYARHTLVAAQVEHVGGVSEMVDAGAAAVFNRRVPPAVLSEELALLIRTRPRDVLVLG